MTQHNNIGMSDKLIRLIIAVVLVILGIRMILYSWVYYAIAIILIVTVTVGFCPFYVLFNISTNKRKVRRITKNEIQAAIKAQEVKKKQSKKKAASKKTSSKASTKTKVASTSKKKKVSKKVTTKKSNTTKKKATKKTTKSKK